MPQDIYVSTHVFIHSMCTRMSLCMEGNMQLTQLNSYNFVYLIQVKYLFWWLYKLNVNMRFDCNTELDIKYSNILLPNCICYNVNHPLLPDSSKDMLCLRKLLYINSNLVRKNDFILLNKSLLLHYLEIVKMMLWFFL